MATFYGGEQLLEVNVYNDVNFPQNTVIRTIPAGRYARMRIINLKRSGGGSAVLQISGSGDNLQTTINVDSTEGIVSEHYSSNSITISQGGSFRNPNSNEFVEEFFLTAGDEVRNLSNPAFLYVIIFEYALP